MKKFLFSKLLLATIFLIVVNGFTAADAQVHIGAANYSTIQAAVNAAVNGDLIIVDPGTFNEDVLVDKSVKISGAGIDKTFVIGVKSIINPLEFTIRINADNVTIEGLTISRSGNNVSEWNDGLNLAGIGINAKNNAVIRYNKFTDNRTAIDINNSNGNMVHNNIIDCNRTGMIIRNNCLNLKVFENFITNSWALGVLWLENTPGLATGATFYNNKIEGNWYAQIENRNTTGGVRDFSGNWLGNCPPTTSTTILTEPDYASVIPTKYGGSATYPGNAVSVRSVILNNVKYTPWLTTNTDINPSTIGFQGDFSKLPVLYLGPDKTRHIGYDAFVTLTANVNGGSGSYNYLWNTGAITQSINVSPTVTTVYSVKVTDKVFTCAAPDEKNITVFIKDVRCGNKLDKVSICHNGSSQCVPQSAVSAHLSHGDELGECPGGSRLNVGKGDEILLETPKELKISNFPNPFYNSTKIKYEVPFEGKVTITVFNQMGREIAIPENSDKKAGSYFVDVNTADYKDGIYYYRVSFVSGKTQLTKTMKMVRKKD